jgi:DNA repair exonuclease SbcCD nuclease subunit
MLSLTLCLATAAFAQMPVLCPLPGTGSSSKAGECSEPISAPANAKHFVFIAAGDNRPEKWCYPQSNVPKKIFTAGSKLKPAFIVWTGDTISGKIYNDSASEVQRVQTEYTEFLSLAQTASVPVFNAPGNHEMDSCSNSPLPEMMNLYKQSMAIPYGAFNYGDSRFIALDSEEPPPSSSSSANEPLSLDGKSESVGYISPEQLEILENDLKANTGKDHIFIFMHHPVIPAKEKDGLSNAEELKKLLEKYPNVSYVFAGHEHMYYNPQNTKGPHYLVTGGAGAPLKDLPGGFNHYLIFTVSGKKVTFKLIKVPKDGPSTQTCEKQECKL